MNLGFAVSQGVFLHLHFILRRPECWPNGAGPWGRGVGHEPPQQGPNSRDGAGVRLGQKSGGGQRGRECFPSLRPAIQARAGTSLIVGTEVEWGLDQGQPIRAIGVLVRLGKSKASGKAHRVILVCVGVAEWNMGARPSDIFCV